jgi:hypothetical protein
MVTRHCRLMINIFDHNYEGKHETISQYASHTFRSSPAGSMSAGRYQVQRGSSIRQWFAQKSTHSTGGSH